MFEHVGEANYTTYFKLARKNLKDDGLFLLQTMGICDKDFPTTEPYNHKYVFPNSACPRQRHITQYVDGLFYIEDWQNLGYDYQTTIAAWVENFKKAWPTLQSEFDDKFYRMWIFYLALGQGLFKSRRMNLWQVVFSKDGLEGGYLSQR